MAPKKVRPSPLEDPPTASSSSGDEDEQQPSSQKPENEEEDGSSSDEGEEEGSSDDEEEENQPKPPSQPASKTPPPPKQSSSSETGSESDPEPTPPPNPKIKPLASKPMKAQPQAQAQPVPARSGAKRPIENINGNGNDTNGNDTKRSKKKTTTSTGDGDDETKAAGKITGEDSKKMSQNQIREEDEIAILKGLADFISKMGKDPLKDSTAFHSFVKNSLHSDPTREQLIRKVRRLKTKFENSDNFNKPHDKKAFELFKKVWGNEVEENGKPNEKIVKSPVKSPIKSTKKEDTNRNSGSAKKEVVESGDDDSSLSLALMEMYRFDNGVGLLGLDKDLAKKGFELMGKSKRVEIEGRWKELQIAELEVFEQRTQFVKDQTSLALQALRKN